MYNQKELMKLSQKKRIKLLEKAKSFEQNSSEQKDFCVLCKSKKGCRRLSCQFDCLGYAFVQCLSCEKVIKIKDDCSKYE